MEEARFKAQLHGIKKPILNSEKLGMLPLLFYGIEVGDFRLVKMAMKMGASIEDTYDIRCERLTAYEFAGRKKCVEAAKYFVSEHKADVNAAIFAVQGKRMPMLAYAVETDDIELARFALLEGAEVDARFRGFFRDVTALMLACESGKVELVELLLQHKADASLGIDGTGPSAYKMCNEISSKAKCLRLLLQNHPLPPDHPEVERCRQGFCTVDRRASYHTIQAVWDEFYPPADEVAIEQETKSE